MSAGVVWVDRTAERKTRLEEGLTDVSLHVINSVKRHGDKLEMKRTLLVGFILMLLLSGCALSWRSVKLTDLSVDPFVPPADVCRECHAMEYETWKANRHSDPERMEKVSVEQLRECGACHLGLGEHSRAPSSSLPQSAGALSKSEQNMLCGKCHFDREIFGKSAVYPHGRHGVLMSVGFDERWKRQISCLDCHSGHSTKAGMLRNIRAHICFRCHKEAIVTMGVFQPFNYLAAGKVCFACHPEHGSSTGRQAARAAAGVAAVCVVCHI